MASGATPVWQKLRDFGAVHTKVAPGFLTDLKMDKGDRILTFFNGMVARERMVTLDNEACRLVYTVVEGQASHYNAAVQVFPAGDGRSVAGHRNFSSQSCHVVSPCWDRTMVMQRPQVWRVSDVVAQVATGTTKTPWRA